MLTLQFIPYADIEDLSSARRIKRLLDIVKTEKIILLEGRLKREEEKDLITITMEEIDERFKGIELAVIYPEKKDLSFLKQIKKGMLSMILGDRQGFTIIGPASIVKEIKKDPDKIQLFTEEEAKKKVKQNGKQSKFD